MVVISRKRVLETRINLWGPITRHPCTHGVCPFTSNLLGLDGSFLTDAVLYQELPCVLPTKAVYFLHTSTLVCALPITILQRTSLSRGRWGESLGGLTPQKEGKLDSPKSLLGHC